MTEKFEPIFEDEKEDQEPNTLELWRELLELFGTDEARENFENLCRRYYGYLVKTRAMENMADEKSAEISDLSRARIHNQIMTTIYSLMSQSKIDPEQRSRFKSLANRKNVAKMIDDVFGIYTPAEKEKFEKMTESGRFRKGIF